MIFLFLFPLLAFADLQGRAALKFPIVLVHGATMGGAVLKIGPFNYGEYFRGIPKFIGETKTDVRVVSLPTDASIGERAIVLKNFLETDLKGKKVNIIAHSLGGLDARYLVSVLKSNQVASITTIATPHYGTPLANWAVRQIKEHTMWYYLFRFFGYDLANRRFLPELTTDYLENKFNPKVPNRSDVHYFSVRSKASFANETMSYLQWFPSHWLEGEHHVLSSDGHDGLVPFISQAWGEEITTVELDHLGEINHHEWRKDMEKESLQLYAEIYDRLLGEGF